MKTFMHHLYSRGVRVRHFSFFQVVLLCITLGSWSCTGPDTATLSNQPEPSRPQERIKPAKYYESSSNCRICHAHIYEQFKESMHAKSFSNPLFKAEFYNILLPRTENEADLLKEAQGCIACHSPTRFIQSGGKVTEFTNLNRGLSGVECDFCHSITGFKGTRPEGGNYIAQPSSVKFGPFNYENDSHRAYSELQTKSEVCAVCHNRKNRYGLEIISTFSEWEKSDYALKGIECQDCHMTVQGFLTKGRPVYESGTVAKGTFIQPKHREKYYTHRFPGAHSETQIEGAIQLEIQVDETTVQPGKETIINVNVDNSRSGHKLPTGSAELRVVYLDVVAEIDGEIIPLVATSLNKDMYDISGKGKFDTTFITDDIPEGRRVYRAICIDGKGQQTLFSFDAARFAFDNRLNANELRKEFFTFIVPVNVGNEFNLSAKMYYYRYTGNFADKLKVSRAKPVEIASASRRVQVAN